MANCSNKTVVLATIKESAPSCVLAGPILLDCLKVLNSKLVIIFVCFLCIRSSAQTKVSFLDSLSDKMSWYGQSKSSTLYVHVDKNIYTPSETIWFKAYLVMSNVSFEKHNTLSVFLTRMEDRKVCLQEKFLMRQGLAAGSLVLPDTLGPGKYIFVAYTNIVMNGKPLAIFTQPIKIKTAPQPSEYLISKDTVIKNKDSFKLRVVAIRSNFQKKCKIQVSYFDVEKEVQVPATITKVSTREVILTLPFRALADRDLKIRVQNGAARTSLSYVLPNNAPFFRVRFYPEGGHLVDSLPSTVGWEVRDNQGNPVTATAVLFEQERPLDTLATNSSGMGTFVLTPRAGKRYLVKLLQQGASDSLYPLPSGFPSGAVIHLPSCLAEDSIRFRVSSTGDGTLYVLVHNYRQLFKAFVLHAKPLASFLSIPLEGVPRGLATITILDSLKRPVAERLFFAHLSSKPVLTITTDSASYHTRSKVQVHLNLQGAGAVPLQGITSVACVQKNRIDSSLYHSIENYVYVEREAGESLGLIHLSGEGRQRDYLEELLLIKGWTDYHWQAVLDAKISDTAASYVSLNMQGDVNKRGRPINKPVDVYLINDTTAKAIPTSATGHFDLAPESLVAPSGRKLNFFLNSKFQAIYQIRFEDPYPTLNNFIAMQLSWSAAPLQSSQPIDKSYLPEAPGKYKLMQTVVVKATKVKDQDYYDRLFETHKIFEGKCSDYVCYLDVLNCPHHPQGTTPREGQLYYTYTATGWQLVMYHSNCSFPAFNLFYSLEGFQPGKNRYGFDFTEINPIEPQYLTTLYWNASVVTDSTGSATLSFYTSDVPGSFKIMVQGRTANDVVSGEASFEVHDNANL